MSPSDTRPMRADARRNWARIVREARSVFAEQGTDASLEEIARRAEVGIGTLYRHFPNRQALVETVFQSRFEHLRAEAEELLGSPSPRDALITWLRSFMANGSAMRGMPASMKVALHDPETELGSACAAVKDAAAALLERAQRAGVANPDTRPMDMLRIANAIAWAADGSRDPASTERMLLLVIDGLGYAGTK